MYRKIYSHANSIRVMMMMMMMTVRGKYCVETFSRREHYWLTFEEKNFTRDVRDLQPKPRYYFLLSPNTCNYKTTTFREGRHFFSRQGIINRS